MLCKNWYLLAEKKKIQVTPSIHELAPLRLLSTSDGVVVEVIIKR